MTEREREEKNHPLLEEGGGRKKERKKERKNEGRIGKCDGQLGVKRSAEGVEEEAESR